MEKLLLCAWIAHGPLLGGMSWAQLQYILGFQKLGYEVYFVENLNHCTDVEGNTAPFEQSINVEYTRKIMDSFGLEHKYSLLYRGGEKSDGLPYEAVVELSKDTVFFVNIMGHFTIKEILGNVERRVYIDTDPGYSQIWHELYKKDMNFSGHDVFFTFGENIGSPGCPVPTCGIEWRKTRPPVVLDFWEPVFSPSLLKFTTVASLYAFAPVLFQGEWWEPKIRELQRFITLPRLTKKKMELAVDIAGTGIDDERLLKENGWIISDPKVVAGNPQSYQEYIKSSGAEFSPVKTGCIKSNSGWFSDRSVCYLASGKPVLLQETGFSEFLPVGEGLLSFRTMEEILQGISELDRDYPRHCRAARKIAEEYFDSEKVLSELINEAGC